MSEIDTRGIHNQLDNMDPNKRRRIVSQVRRSADAALTIQDSAQFFKDIARPCNSPVYDYIERVMAKDARHENFQTPARIMEFNLSSSRYRYRSLKNTTHLAEAITKSRQMNGIVQKLRESGIRARREKMRGLKEDFFDGGFGFGNGASTGDSIGAFNVKAEYTPLLGTPFYKQMYLYDYLQMHSKCFYMKNYSGLAKNIIGNIRNFVIGRGFSVTIPKDNEKAQEAWDKYLERSNIEIEVRNWTDELTTFGEMFLKKIPTPEGIIHRSVDPSTIWEIVTDPENIYDVKYYHQQYNTQYQLYGDKNTPLSVYVLQHLAPELIRHYKVNVTSYEKRGRSDLLSALLYLNYYENYTQFKLLRVKNEAAFLWDTTVKGDEGDVEAYISQTESLENVPPGSENVHNEAIMRTPMAAPFSHSGTDDVMKWIVSYVCMSVNIPANYLGLLESSGGSTRAGALVATEPVIRMFDERRTFIEKMMNDVFDDVMIDAGLDPKKVDREFNFPEFVNEDRSKKIQDLIVAKDEKVITHRRMSGLVAKEFSITNYDYEKEQADIQEELVEQPLIDTPIPDMDVAPGGEGPGQAAPGNKPPLTKSGGGDQTKDDRAFNRDDVRQQSKSY